MQSDLDSMELFINDEEWDGVTIANTEVIRKEILKCIKVSSGIIDPPQDQDLCFSVNIVKHNIYVVEFNSEQK